MAEDKHPHCGVNLGGPSLKSELLLQIQDAEATAAKRIATAEAQAKQILADARREADAMAAEGREQADHAYQSMLDAARAEADAEAKTLMDAGNAEAAQLRDGFEGRAAGSADRILALFEESL